MNDIQEARAAMQLEVSHHGHSRAVGFWTWALKRRGADISQQERATTWWRSIMPTSR